MTLPWDLVTSLRLHPIGPVSPEVFGWRYEPDWCEACGEEHAGGYRIIDRPRALQVREEWGQLCYDPRFGVPQRHPYYSGLCALHLALSEGDC